MISSVAPWWVGKVDGRYFTVEYQEMQIVMGPYPITDGYGSFGLVVQRDSNGNIRRCEELLGSRNEGKTKVSGRWESGGKAGDWTAGDTIEQVSEC